MMHTPAHQQLDPNKAPAQILGTDNRSKSSKPQVLELHSHCKSRKRRRSEGEMAHLVAAASA